MGMSRKRFTKKLMSMSGRRSIGTDENGEPIMSDELRRIQRNTANAIWASRIQRRNERLARDKEEKDRLIDACAVGIAIPILAPMMDDEEADVQSSMKIAEHINGMEGISKRMKKKIMRKVLNRDSFNEMWVRIALAKQYLKDHPEYGREEAEAE